MLTPMRTILLISLFLASCSQHSTQVRKTFSLENQKNENWLIQNMREGLIIPRVTSKEAKKAFQKRVCQKLSKDTCKSRFKNKIFSLLQLRYTWADWDRARTLCAAHPAACSITQYERWLFESHNTFVYRDYLAQKERITANEQEALQIAQERDARETQQVVETIEETLYGPKTTYIECKKKPGLTKCTQKRDANY